MITKQSNAHITTCLNSSKLVDEVEGKITENIVLDAEERKGF